MNKEENIAIKRINEVKSNNNVNNMAKVNNANLHQPNSSLEKLNNKQNLNPYYANNQKNNPSYNNLNSSQNGNSNVDLNSLNSSTLKKNNDIESKNNRQLKLKNAANNIAAKYLKTKGVPEWVTKMAMNKNRSKSIPGMAAGLSKQRLLNPVANMFGKRKGTEAVKSEESEVNMGLSIQLIRTIGVLAPFAFLSLSLFLCLFAGTQTYVNAKKLHHAYSSEELEDFMNDNMTDEQKNLETDQDDVDKLDNSSTFNFIDDTKSNFVMVARKAEKFETAEMAELKDYYSYVTGYDNINSEEVLYKFFFKLDFIKKFYKKNYQVELDIPLLMSTLILQSDDMNVVFESNTKSFSYKTCRTKVGDTYDYSGCWDKDSEHFIKYAASYANKYFSYDHDWSNYKIGFKNSKHDIEVLAQHMISYQATETCRNSSGNIVSTNVLREDEIGTQVLACKEGETYNVTPASYELDDEKYNEFLKQFIEKKYILDHDSDYYDEYSLDTEDSSGSVSSNFTKYTFEGDLLEQIASVCYREQGSAKGAAAEASLIANRFEYYGESYQSKYGITGLGLYHYLLESGWWGNPSSTMSQKSAPDSVVEAVRNVLVEGKRTLPRYVDEHDCWNCNPQRCSDGKKGDICSINTNGVSLTAMSKIRKRSNYAKNSTIINNIYGATYTFYSFPTDDSDPFGYLSEKLRQTVGECYYNYDTGQFVNCGTSFITTFLSWLKSIAQDDSHGYSQVHRDSMIDYDCSSLVYYGLINSGFNTEQLGTTAFTVSGEGAILKQNGFEELKFSDLVPDGQTTTNLKPGDILVSNSHTEVYFGEGMNVGAHQSETGGITGDYGDQTGKEIYIGQFWNDNWQYVYRYGG